MEAAVTSEEEDPNSQDFNIPIDHGHLAWNCLTKFITPAVKAFVFSGYYLSSSRTKLSHETDKWY